ncbi:hypothetical protein [Caballeronia grimmiae]|uniref:hypothetical protein n=1 Tax=Caballeronia grimmiae TaxID=1071679 RepID=UPI001267C4C9|nr:hypothetical protein [Caballeronia grimmiae]
MLTESGHRCFQAPSGFACKPASRLYAFARNASRPLAPAKTRSNYFAWNRNRRETAGFGREETVVAIQLTHSLRAVRPNIGLPALPARARIIMRAARSPADTADSPATAAPFHPSFFDASGDIRGQSFFVQVSGGDKQ